MIEFNHVSKRYANGFDALLDINFSIAKGEMAFLTGHSGAGKSTLLKLLTALERSTAGDVIVGGYNLSRLNATRASLIRRSIGIIFQEHKLLMNRCVFDNVALPLEIAGFTPSDIRRRVHAALDKVGLLHKEKMLPVVLSGGEQQRVGIARAIVNKPAVLIADEPTGNLDPVLSTEIMQLFDEFNHVGVTVLIATHNVLLISSMQNRTLNLTHGRLTVDSEQKDIAA